MMAISAEAESFTSLGIKFDLRKVITCAPKVGEYTCGAGCVNCCVIHFITCVPMEGKCK